MHRWVRVFDPEGLRELLGDQRVARTEGPVPAGEGSDGFVGACRDAEFVRWRYREHPRFRYEVIEGRTAYRIEPVADSSATVMRIVDFLGDDRLATRLAEAAERAGVVFADFACSSARFGRSLEGAGFERERATALPARFQPLDFSDRPIVSCFWGAPRLGIDFAAGDLYVTRADSDLDRPN
jgi:hypothetical protein